MYHESLAAGRLFREMQVTLTLSPMLYRGWPPWISGPSSGRSKHTFIEQSVQDGLGTFFKKGAKQFDFRIF